MVIYHFERAAALTTHVAPFPLGVWQRNCEQRRSYLHWRWWLEVVLQGRRVDWRLGGIAQQALALFEAMRLQVGLEREQCMSSKTQEALVMVVLQIVRQPLQPLLE